MGLRRGDGALGVLILYLTVVLFWGSTFLWVELATDHTSPFVVSALRLAVGAATVLGISALLGEEMRRAHSRVALRPWLWKGVLLALLSAVIPSLLLAIAQRYIASGTASILNATAPLWTALIAWILIRGPAGRLRPIQVGGLFLGVAGVALLAGDAGTGGEVKGMLIMVALAAIYASGGVYAQRSFGGAPPLTAALTVTVLGAVLAAPLGVVGWIADPPTLGAFGALLALGVTSSGIAYIGYFELIRRIGATRTLTVTYLQPAVAIGLGVAILGEELKALHLVGLGLVLLGVAITNARSARAPRSGAAGARAPQAADAAAEPPAREGSRVVREG